MNTQNQYDLKLKRGKKKISNLL